MSSIRPSGKSRPTLVFIPCFSGAAWDLTPFPMFREWPTRTPPLPGLRRVAEYAAWVDQVTRDLPSYVLVGDSFGAAVALWWAARRPSRLVGLVASGGFVSNPLRSPALLAWIRHGPRLSGWAYRRLVIPWHARLLASPYDQSGDRPWNIGDTVRLFLAATPAHDYWLRAEAAVTADFAADVVHIAVPTLILTPEHDRLIAPPAAAPLTAIPGHREQRLPAAGHLFRFTHPTAYGRAVQKFLEEVGRGD